MKSMVLVAGLIVVPAAVSQQQERNLEKAQAADPRLLRLQQFFAARDCPLREMAADFLAAADVNALDWRLLPSISFIESSGGKDYRNNNVFGWDTPLQNFSSIREGIQYVAAQLASADRYKNKSLDGKLRTYNPNPAYPHKVKAVMRALGPSETRSNTLD
ncbi:MAG TPA: hypothetical protein VLW25_09550 [Bryobacteraceae bacterium]|jgi:hypothetical protein|nr:hypothetical protein [Bryobacteraceae bacterium]